MKKISIYQSKLGLVWGIFITCLGLQISCTLDNPNDRNVQVFLQIPLPNPDGLKNASSIAGVKSVMLTVTTGNEILTSKELTISGNTANGTVSIMPGENIKFTAEARDANNIIQWQGSTTVDIVDDFTANIQLTPILPTANILKALEKGKSVNLSWNQNSDPDFARYELYRSQSNSTLGTILHSTTLITETEFDDNLALEGSSYFYTLVVTDTEGFNTQSSVSIKPNYPPTAVVLYGSEDGYIYLSWTRNYDSDFARYELYRSNSINVLGTKISSTSNVNELYFTDQSVVEGNTYYYRLVVFDTSGSGTGSKEVQVVMYNYPPTVSSLTAAKVSRTAVVLTWSQNYDLDFDRYELYRSQSDSLSATIIKSINVNTITNFDDTSVSPGSTYYYRLIVFDISGLSTKSTFVYVITPK